jgi:hypothetical protein
MEWMTRVFPCSICGNPLNDGYDPRYPGKTVTLHHTEGSREEDRWNDLGYVAKMVPCHSSCHRSYHLSLRHKAAGKKVGVNLEAMEANIQKALGRLQVLISALTPLTQAETTEES